jgi:polar amino acid transport system permease protein
MSVTVTTPSSTEQPDRRSWWQRPKLIVALLAVAGVMYLLTGLARRRLRFDTDVLPTAAPDQFSWTFARSLVPDLLNALSVTATVTLYGFALALLLGLVFALGRRSTKRWLSWPFAGLIEFIRSTPLLVQLFFLFYALPPLGIVLDPLQAVVLGLGIHYGTYCSEAYRAGINSVPKGQWEASTALNLGTTARWGRVILPQAIPNVLPALGNFLVAGFKDAPLGAAIQVSGVLFFASTISSRFFRPVEPYLMIGLGFLIVSLPAAWLVRRLEYRIGYERT